MSRPDPAYWELDEPKKFEKARKILPKEVQIAYIEKIDRMIHSVYPIGHADKWEQTKYGLVWMARLNKHYRFSYLLDYSQKVIVLVRIDDHKDVGTEK